MRFETGIGAKLEFKFVKGHRNPYAGVNIEDKDCFTLPPSTGDQPELDLSLVLLSLAFDRGLFGSRTPEELWEGPEVSEQILMLSTSTYHIAEIH